VGEPLGIERLSVVGQDHPEVKGRHGRTLSPGSPRLDSRGTAEGGRGMKAKEWIALYAEHLDTAPPTAEELEAILDLAAEAAHASERIAAPVACWLSAKAGRSPAESLAVAQAMSHVPPA
jgi:hypothetical protein